MILQYEQYVPVIQEILTHCYETKYCSEVYSNYQKAEPEWIDKMHVWSHDKDFCNFLASELPACIAKI